MWTNKDYKRRNEHKKKIAYRAMSFNQTDVYYI